MMDHRTDLLTKVDVARIWGVSPATVLLAANRGRLPIAARTPGGTRLFARADVERLARDRKRRGLKGGSTQRTSEFRVRETAA
jgi:DNA-binding transcriptional MerR regulator